MEKGMDLKGEHRALEEDHQRITTQHSSILLRLTQIREDQRKLANTVRWIFVLSGFTTGMVLGGLLFR